MRPFINEKIDLAECPEMIRRAYQETVKPIIAQRYPNLYGVLPIIQRGPSERALSERLGILRTSIKPTMEIDLDLYKSAAANLPIEYRFSYFKLGDNRNPYDETLVIYLNLDGEIVGELHSFLSFLWEKELTFQLTSVMASWCTMQKH